MKVRKLFICLLCLCTLLLGFSLNVNAETKTFYNDQKTSNFTTNVKEDRELYPGTRFVYDAGYTMRDKYKFDQDAYLLFQKSDALKGSKTVTWSIYEENHGVSQAFSRATLANIAKDYELNHPGWKVVGGINADQYYWKYGTGLGSNGSDIFENQPYYGMKADNENWFTVDAYGRIACNMTGFKNDGSTNPLVYNNGNTFLGFKINVYDENHNLLGKFDVNDLNPKNNDSGTYVYALTDTGNKEDPLSRDKASKSVNVKANTDLYIVKGADKTFVSNSTDYSWYKGASARNAFFGKGEITEISKEVTLKATDFAIRTDNNELLKVLKKGSYVVCQQEVGGGYEECEAATGWHAIQKLNGVDQNVGGGYNTKGYPRSAFGCTKNGEIVLLNGNGTGSSGFTGNELNALCKAYDIDTLFQMDGGGSASMIIRDEKGEFITVNNPSDGHDRQIFSGLFFVVKDVTAEIKINSIKEDSLEFNVDIKDFGIDKEVTNAYINLTGKTINGLPYNETKEIVDNKVVFNDLASDHEFVYKITFKVKGEEQIRESLTMNTIKTAKCTPSIEKIKLVKEDDDLKVRLYIDDLNDAISGFISISFDGGKTFEFIKPGKELVLKGFKGDPFNDIVIKYNYDINDNNGSQEMVIKNGFEIKYNCIIIMDSILYQSNNAIKNIFK